MGQVGGLCIHFFLYLVKKKGFLSIIKTFFFSINYYNPYNMFKLYSKNLNLLRLILKISKSIKQKKILNEDNKINLYI